MAKTVKVAPARKERDEALMVAAGIINASYLAAMEDKDYGQASIRAAKMLRSRGLLIDTRKSTADEQQPVPPGSDAPSPT